MGCLRARWLILAILCVLASLPVPGIASASTAERAETRVWAFDLQNQSGIGVDRSLTQELHPGCGLAYYKLATDSLLAAKGAASAARGASTAFGRSVQSLKEFVGGGKGPWVRLSAHAEQATKRGLRGGTSLEEVFRNTETGQQIIRHTLINRSGNVVHETFRTYSKFDG